MKKYKQDSPGIGAMANFVSPHNYVFFGVILKQNTWLYNIQFGPIWQFIMRSS